MTDPSCRHCYRHNHQSFITYYHPLPRLPFLPPPPSSFIRIRPRRPCHQSPSFAPAPIYTSPITARDTSIPTSPAVSSDPNQIWARVRIAVPLSRVFSDHLSGGHQALHQLSAHKFKVVCPFHNDKNPSLHIDDNLGLFNCFGCGAKGSIIDFEQLISGHRSVSTALRSLASKYPSIASVLRQSSIHLSSSSDNHNDNDNNQIQLVNNNVVKPKISRRVLIAQKAIVRDVLQQALIAYTNAFWNKSTPQALQYLRNQRALSTPTLRAFSCGFSPLPSLTSSSTNSFIVTHFQSLGHDLDDVVLSGIVRAVDLDDSNKNSSSSSANKRYYDVLRNRVIFPIRDVTGQVLSFAGRSLPSSTPSSESKAKYMNGGDSALFTKRDVLFGADVASTAHSATIDTGFVIMVEGYLDVMTIFDRTEGRVASVATMGTAASIEQLKKAYSLLSDGIDGKIIINYDADDAGFKAVERLCDSVIPKLTDCAFAFYIAFTPHPFKDADEYLSNCSNSEEYIDHLLINAVPWYQWRGDRVVQAELLHMEAIEEGNGVGEKEEENIEKRNDKMNNRHEMNLLEMEKALENTIDEASFNAILSDYMRAQDDDFAVAFGAKRKDISGSKLTANDPPPLREEVLDTLANILTSANNCVPGLNIPALVQSWSDSLTRSTPRLMFPLCNDLIKRMERLSESTTALSAQEQAYWLPPPPWLLDELPAWKRKSLGYGLDVSSIPSSPSGFKSAETTNNGIGIGDSVNSDKENSYSLLSDSKFMKRSLQRLEAQENTVIPFLKSRECERSRRLKQAPRQSAEEIILRALIFASEVDRLDALQALLDVIIRCGEQDLPFWTCRSRESLFEYLVNIEGPMNAEDIAAYLEEFDWFTSEIEELFTPIEEEQEDESWYQIRELEIKKPVDVVTSTAQSVEKMAKLVARRLALKSSGMVLQEMLEKKTQIEQVVTTEDDKRSKLEQELKELEEKRTALNMEIDGSKFLSEEEKKSLEEANQKRKYNIELEKEKEHFWKDIEEKGEAFVPDWLPEDNNKNVPPRSSSMYQ